MSKYFVVDFYRVEMPESESSFEDVLGRVMAMPKEDRTHKFASAPIRLQVAEKVQNTNNQEFWHGELVKIRMIEPPVKASLSGDLEDIQLDDDEGIGERTVFMYFPAMRVLLLHKTLAGVSITSLLSYFQKITGMQHEMAADPVLNSDAMRRLDNFEVLQKIDLRVAGLDNLSIFQQDDRAIGDILDNVSKAFKAPSVSITASMAGRKGTLDKEMVSQLIKKFLRFSAGQKNSSDDKSSPTTRVMRITGKDSEESRNSSIVDLLRDCMREKLKTPADSTRRNLTYNERKDFLNDAWQKRKAEIEKMFTKP
jgi:hypothetical protein